MSTAESSSFQPNVGRHPVVTCIILNWNNQARTVVCLAGLRQWAGDAYRLRVVVVDNGSTKLETGPILAAFPGVELVRLAENHGFTGGCNVGAATKAALTSDYLLFLNNDTLVKNDFLAPLVHLLEGNPTIGIVSPIERILEPATISSFRVEVNLARGTSIGVPHPVPPDLSQPCFHSSDTAHGGMMLLRTSLFRDLRGFDESYFAYFEDVDLCLRAQHRGFACGFYVSSEVYHWGADSTRHSADGGNLLRDCLVQRNSILLVRKHATFRQRLVFLGLYLPYRSLRFALGRLRRGRWRQTLPFLRWTLLGTFQKLDNPPSKPMLRMLGLR